jgi:hypothetical protein
MMNRFTPIYLMRWLVLIGLLMTLTGCFEEKKTSVDYQGANHTDIAAIYVTINGSGGIMNVSEHGYGGNVCCVNIPQTWRPDLTVTIGWQDEGHWLLDDKGKEVLKGGRKILVESPRKFKTVTIPKYDIPETLWIHFFPNDEVKVVMSKYGPGHPKHGLPDPEQPERERREKAQQKTNTP